MMEQAKVVESYEEAEKESLKGDDEAVEEPVGAKGKEAEGSGKKKAKKGWLW